MEVGTLSSATVTYPVPRETYRGGQREYANQVPQTSASPPQVRPDVDIEPVSLQGMMVDFGEVRDEFQQRLKRLIEEMNSNPMLQMRHLRFDFLDDLRQLTVQVVDVRNNSVMRTMPPEEFVELRQRLHQNLGSFVDRVA